MLISFRTRCLGPQAMVINLILNLAQELLLCPLFCQEFSKLQKESLEHLKTSKKVSCLSFKVCWTPKILRPLRRLKNHKSKIYKLKILWRSRMMRPKKIKAYVQHIWNLIFWRRIWGHWRLKITPKVNREDRNSKARDMKPKTLSYTKIIKKILFKFLQNNYNGKSSETSAKASIWQELDHKKEKLSSLSGYKTLATSQSYLKTSQALAV